MATVFKNLRQSKSNRIKAKNIFINEMDSSQSEDSLEI